MFGGVRIGQYAGAPIVIDWSVAILAAFLVLDALLRAGLGGLPFAIVTLAALLAAVFIHEMAHAIAAVAFRIPNRRIVLTGFGGFVETAWRPALRSQDMAIAAAGPLSNLACAALGFAALRMLAPSDPFAAFGAPALPVQLVERFAQISLVLGAFNLLPGYPLDGGHILRTALSYRLRDATGRRITAWIGVVIGGYLALAGFATGAIWMGGVGFYLATTAMEEVRRVRGVRR